MTAINPRINFAPVGLGSAEKLIAITTTLIHVAKRMAVSGHAFHNAVRQ